MTHLSESSPSNLAETALLRGSDDLLVDFDRAYYIFQPCHIVDQVVATWFLAG